MNTNDKPKAHPSLAALGFLLIGGGSGLVHQAARTDLFYDRLAETGTNAWLAPFGWLLILAGAVVLITGVARLLKAP